MDSGASGLVSVWVSSHKVVFGPFHTVVILIIFEHPDGLAGFTTAVLGDPQVLNVVAVPCELVEIPRLDTALVRRVTLKRLGSIDPYIDFKASYTVHDVIFGVSAVTTGT